MKIVIWIADEPNQLALANKINEEFPLSGMVLERRNIKRKLNYNLIQRILTRILYPQAIQAWKELQSYYKNKYNKPPKCESLIVEDINDNGTGIFTSKIKPDLILVSGTKLVGARLLQLKPKNGILNLHTGISPYVKGGPNCTNWCIATNNFHLIGNTIMWLDEGIDTGDILTTEQTKFDNHDNNLYKIHLRVMNHAHILYLNSIHCIQKNQIQKIPQDTIGKGRTFYNKQWGLKQNYLLNKNLKNMIDSVKNGNNLNKKIQLISLQK